VSGGPLPPDIRAVLNDGLERIRLGQVQMDTVLLHVDTAGASPSIVAWRAGRAEGQRPAIVGVVADTRLVTDMFARILQQSPLLPPSLAREPKDLLTVRVTTPDRRELFSSSPVWSAYTSETRVDERLGGFRVAVALTGPAADRLIIGGLPRSRVPLLIGLLAITTGLIAVALVQLKRERELIRLRADFVSGVSHELRTPLAQIRLFGETLLLNRVRSAEERHRSLEIIVQESQRLTLLIENVLQFARLERGAASGVTTKPERLDVLMRDIVEAFEPLARSKRATIARQIDDDIVAPVDAGALRQIVLNLLDNALKYGPPGQTIVVTCRYEGGVAAITIEDEGPGVPDADASRIWNAFYRGRRDGGASGGTGIGLAIVKRLTDLHGGRVSVGRGSRGARFAVELPGATREHVSDDARVALGGVQP
jgi:signal transduction histidine kinase